MFAISCFLSNYTYILLSVIILTEESEQCGSIFHRRQAIVALHE